MKQIIVITRSVRDNTNNRIKQHQQQINNDVRQTNKPKSYYDIMAQNIVDKYLSEKKENMTDIVSRKLQLEDELSFLEY